MAKEQHDPHLNRLYARILTQLFPEQTKSIPRMIVWSIIFIMYLTACIFGANYLGLLNSQLGVIATIVIVIGGYWLMGKIWYTVVKCFRKRE